MGSAASHFIREIHMPTIVVKRELKPGKRVYVMAVDGSARAKQGLAVLLTLVLAKDTVIIAHVEEVTDDSSEEGLVALRDYYEKQVDQYCPSQSQYISLLTGDKSVVDTLMEYVDEIDPDFLVVAPAPVKTTASVTEIVMARTTSNVILCKSWTD